MDYKIVSLTEHNDGSVTIVARFYDGAETTEDELVRETVTSVTRYRRTSLFTEYEYTTNPLTQNQKDRLLNFLNKAVDTLAKGRGKNVIAKQSDTSVDVSDIIVTT